MKKTTFLIALSFLILGCQSPKEKTEEPFKTLTKLTDEYAKSILDNGNISSIALAIYKNGKVYSNYYGKENVKDSTLFELASISKVFCGSLIAKAVLEKKLKLEDNIQDYLGAGYSNLEYKGAPITIKHLLTHTLGFKERKPKRLAEVLNKISKGYYKNKAIDYNITSFLEDLKTVELDKKPGTFYEYNSVGSEILAYILQQVYSKSYKDLHNNFLVEIGMKNTYLQDYKKHKKHLMVGYNNDGELATIDKNPLLGGGSGMVANLPDLIKFMKFQLENNNPLIKESTRELFKGEENDTMGYLWDTGIAEEEGFFYSKTGTSHGTQSSILLCPDSKYGIIVIVNGTSDAALKDWANLYFTKIEVDLIKFPKLNLKSILKPAFLKDKKNAKKEFNKLKIDKEKYFNTNLTSALNSIGYDLMNSKKNLNQSIDILKFAINEEPQNFNLYDSLGEAYFTAKDYKNALLNYKKSLKLNPENSNAEEFIAEINTLIKA